MKKKDLGGKIKQARLQYSQRSGTKLTQLALAEKVGISRSYMGDIESGRTYPTFVVLSAIAETCGVSLSFFGADADEMKSILEAPDTPQPPPPTNFAAIPVLGVIRAGEPISAQQNIISYEYIPCEMARSGEYFGLRVTGDSMNNSRIFDGDIVLVRRQEEVENGEIAAILVDGEDATIKKFYKTDSMITLMPDSSNKDYQPRFIDISKNEVKILGKVIKVIINL